MSREINRQGRLAARSIRSMGIRKTFVRNTSLPTDLRLPPLSGHTDLFEKLFGPCSSLHACRHVRPPPPGPFIRLRYTHRPLSSNFRPVIPPRPDLYFLPVIGLPLLCVAPFLVPVPPSYVQSFIVPLFKASPPPRAKKRPPYINNGRGAPRQ